jgi:hypothetical protein
VIVVVPVEVAIEVVVVVVVNPVVVVLDRVVVTEIESAPPVPVEVIATRKFRRLGATDVLTSDRAGAMTAVLE